LDVLMYLYQSGADLTKKNLDGLTVFGMVNREERFPAPVWEHEHVDPADQDAVHDFLLNIETKVKLDELFDSTINIGQCLEEEHCPITLIPLTKLITKKRLIKIDGRCWSFHCFAMYEDDDPGWKINPLTRQRFNSSDIEKLKKIRLYRQTLMKELANDYYEVGGRKVGRHMARQKRIKKMTVKARRKKSKRIVKSISRKK